MPQTLININTHKNQNNQTHQVETSLRVGAFRLVGLGSDHLGFNVSLATLLAVTIKVTVEC